RLFLWGSPLAVFLSIANSDDSVEEKFDLPSRLDVYNIFHAHDPVAFRLDPLMAEHYPREPLVLPHWQDNELRSNKLWQRDISDAKGQLSWIQLMFSGLTAEDPPFEDALPEVCSEEETRHRVDYILQESTTEGIVHSVHRMSIISAHSCYWSSRDLAMFMLKVLAGSIAAVLLCDLNTIGPGTDPTAPLYMDDEMSTR
ncbi:hypothetical protein FOZ62_031092, partial [Perkinsus olseni]